MRIRNLTALLFILSAIAGRAQYWDEQVIPPPLDVTSTAQFGSSLSMEGDYLLVGAPGSDDAGPNAGAAYIFRREEGGTDDWDLLVRLAPPLLSENAGFGTTVLLRNGQAFVGAPDQRFGLVQTGAVFVFGQQEGGPDAWGYLQRLTAPEPEAGMEFGTSIELKGDTLVAGMPGLLPPGPDPDVFQAGGFAKFVRAQDGSWTDQGATYLRWAGEAGLIHSGLFLSSKRANDGTRAGYFLQLDSFWFSPGATIPQPDEQELNLYWTGLKSPWDWDAEMHNPANIYLSGPTMAAAGPYVAVSDDELITMFEIPGENGDSTTSVREPLVVVVTGEGDGSLRPHGFARAPGVPISKSLTRFGHSVVFSEHRLVIGAPGANTGSPVGNVRLFGLDTVPLTDSLPLLATLYPSQAAFGDLFGWSLAANAGTIAVGAPGHGADDRGQVHVFLDPDASEPVGIVEQPQDPFVIRPNPASDFIEVNLPRNAGEARLELIDMTGRSVLRMLMRRDVERVDVSALATGPYHLICSVVDDPSSRNCARVIIFR